MYSYFAVYPPGQFLRSALHHQEKITTNNWTRLLEDSSINWMYRLSCKSTPSKHAGGGNNPFVISSLCVPLWTLWDAGDFRTCIDGVNTARSSVHRVRPWPPLTSNSNRCTVNRQDVPSSLIVVMFSFHRPGRFHRKFAKLGNLLILQNFLRWDSGSSNFGLVGRTGALHTSYCTVV